MEAERQSVCTVPRGLVNWDVTETFVCGICDASFREPRHASTCSSDRFCRTCQQAVDASKPLKDADHFEAMVNITLVRSPTSTAEKGGAGGTISQVPATSRDSVQAPGVKKEAGDGGGNAPPRAGVAGRSETSSSPFDGEVACAMQKAWGAERPRSCVGEWGGFTGDYGELELEELQEEARCEGLDLMTWDSAGSVAGGAGGSESSSSPFDGVMNQDLVALCKMRSLASWTKASGQKSKAELLLTCTPLYNTPKEVAAALQEAWGAARPRSYGGKWGGLTGDYEELELEELQAEARCEGVDLMIFDSEAGGRRPKSEHQLRIGLTKRRDACRAYAPDPAFPTQRLDLAVSPSAKESSKATPTKGGKACRAETVSGSAGSGGVGAGGAALTLGGKIASMASVVWDRREMQQMNKDDVIDLARDSGLTYCSNGHSLPRPDLEERISNAHTFAASLRAKHPSSCERSASTWGGWWGFPGDYQVLDRGDLEAEATFCGIQTTYYNKNTDAMEHKTLQQLCKTLRKRRANFEPDLDDVLASTPPSEAWGAALTLGGKIATTASVVSVSRELQQMSMKGLIDLARNGGLPFSDANGPLPKSDLEERISNAHTFAASLRAKHPNSCERGASARGDWWGFPGDYEVLDRWDLEAEANFCGVRRNQGSGLEKVSSEALCKALRKRRANYAPDLDDVLASAPPPKRICRAATAGAGGTCEGETSQHVGGGGQELSAAAPNDTPRHRCTLPLLYRVGWFGIMPVRPDGRRRHLADLRAAIGAEPPGDPDADTLLSSGICEIYAAHFEIHGGGCPRDGPRLPAFHVTFLATGETCCDTAEDLRAWALTRLESRQAGLIPKKRPASASDGGVKGSVLPGGVGMRALRDEEIEEPSSSDDE
ncbi:hypothetical protein T484DRAFT_1908082 [Baffinella frigidus]|nr:hypothetical protein T484DRAFT_1908082 [Cryptophyta sp. CCMP2293]